MIRKLVLLVSVLAIVATVSDTQAQTLNVAQQGDKAVLFDINGMNLNAYQGGIGVKYFVSDGMAIRGMLLFGMDNKTTGGAPQTTDNSLSFGISGALEYHLPLSSRLSPYVGGGLLFQTAAETVNNGFGSSKTSSTSFGLGAIGGVEYFFNQNLSLSGEYQFGFTTSNATATDQSEFTLGFQSAGLTLAAYF